MVLMKNVTPEPHTDEDGWCWAVAVHPTPLMPLVFRPLVCLPAQELHDLGQAIFFSDSIFSFKKIKVEWQGSLWDSL